LVSKDKKVLGVTGAQHIVRIYKEFSNNNKYTNVIENEKESILTFRPTSGSCPCHIKPQTNLTDFMLNEKNTEGNTYEGSNFNSGNYLFTTDTK